MEKLCFATDEMLTTKHSTGVLNKNRLSKCTKIGQVTAIKVARTL